MNKKSINKLNCKFQRIDEKPQNGIKLSEK